MNRFETAYTVALMRLMPSSWAIACTLAVALALSPAAVGQGRDEPGPLAVAAASDLQVVFPQLAARFEREARVPVRVSFASSGTLLAQIRAGAPFDVFLSADIDYPRQLAADGHGDAASLYEYAAGRLALVTRRDSGLDVTRGLAVVADARVRRVAIANPQHAPYGRAALAALRHDGLDAAVRPRLVLGENVSQAAQFVQSGNAQVGLIALSLAVAPAMRGDTVHVEVPAASHPPIRQGAIVVSASRHKIAAAAWLAFLRRPDTVALLVRHGFAPPAGIR